MKYIIRETQEELTFHQLRLAFPSTGFALDPDADFLDTLGVDKLIEVDAPVVTATQKAVRAGTEVINGLLYQKWNVVPLSQDEIAQLVSDKMQKVVIKIDGDVDWLYGKVLGNRATEYARAEEEAQAFKDAGYPAGSVPNSVASWATATGNDAVWAANNILTTAAGLRNAQDSVRLHRLTQKEKAKAATTLAELDTVQQEWSGFMTVIRQSLGV